MIMAWTGSSSGSSQRLGVAPAHNADDARAL